MVLPGPDSISAIGKKYLEYLTDVLATCETKSTRIEKLIQLIQGARAIHVYGFGRSGAAALAFAIRLRHFCNVLPPVWWVGDQVREPIRNGDLLIIFSGSGDRPEIATVARKGKQASACLVLITATETLPPGLAPDLIILLPKIPNVPVYGGGDFELGAYFLQEVLVIHIGTMLGIPVNEVGKNHV
ncbi:SIS domain-containing protein [uncultured Methanoregula sp.]|uniref:SIS domain-containing protein n=1 Tax=uncultured Methanoregula sp. TaxID=1005933 RepID=UPI002AAC3F67|nr:SIS domain-containing protein [uncultured Methanoregula sp.]